MSAARWVIRHPLTRLSFTAVFTVLAIEGFVEQGDFWDGILTALWVALAVGEAFELLLWWAQRGRQAQL